jgi:NAD(P)-dependent dehydrogenase (short-subunit alcohol dehydrogenase family)
VVGDEEEIEGCGSLTSDQTRSAGRVGFAGRPVGVFGAGQGIGRACAEELSMVGARVLCVDIDEQRAINAAAAVGGVALSCDVTSPEGVREVRRVVASSPEPFLGFVDVVGRAVLKSFEDLTAGDWYSQFAEVFHHAHLLSRELRSAIAAGGSIVLISSVAGNAWAGARSGLFGRQGRLELPYSIAGGRVRPGSKSQRCCAWLGCHATAEGGHGAGAFCAVRLSVASSACGGAPDVARTVLFLFSDLAAYMTGQILNVDGGLSVLPCEF